MNNQSGRQQTTKGIWLSKNGGNNILILDIEGTDSIERGEQRMTFEQTLSLFALAMSDVLLINMWYTDIGRYSASNYGLLKVIFECNLKLFGNNVKKRLLFVIRDFDPEGNADAIRGIIDKNVKTIWDEMHKPEEHKNKTVEDFFVLDIALMPHGKLQKKEFKEKCAELTARFEKGAPDTFFPALDYKNVPMDGLGVYIDGTWDVIRNQKELNLPDQREIVANYRCGEIKDEARELIKEDFQKLKAECESKEAVGFGEKSMELLNKAVKYYDDEANHYQQSVYLKVKTDLAKDIFNMLQDIFDQQLFSSKKNIEKEFD